MQSTTICETTQELRPSIQQVNQYWMDRDLPPLTPTQAEIVDTILGKVKDPGSVYNLEGPAGTGKTTLLLALAMAASLEERRLIISAFTHKACSVLRDKLEATAATWPSKLPSPVTLHSLLNLKPKAPKFNEPQQFYQSRVPDLSMTDLLIVDECSMVGINLIEYIEAVRAQGVSVLYAGDPYQLRPVNETKKSKSFSGGTKFRLTEVLRHDGAVLNLATNTRKMKAVPSFRTSVSGGSSVRVFETKEEFERDWIQTLREAEEAGDADSVLMLTYKNENRRKYNDRARKALFGAEVPRFLAGDLVMALDPVIQGDEIIYANNQDISIVGNPRFIQNSRPVANLDFSCDYWSLNTAEGRVILVIEPECEGAYKNYLKALGKSIEAENKAAQTVAARRNAKARWSEEYFVLKGVFANVDFRYALTVHKSQGSTFQNVYVNDDYKQGRSEAVSLFYVAVTRAAKSVNLIQK